MKIDTIRLLKAALAMLTLGVFAIAVAAPVTLDHGMLVQKAAYAKNGADDNGGHGGHGGHGGDDGTDTADDDGTLDQGPGDN